MLDLKKKILIDTDNGDDIDDLFALYFALGRNDLEIVGITTTYVNTNLRARQIKKVLSLANKTDIPVYSGYGIPIKTLHPCDINYKFCQYTPDLLLDSYAPINDIEGCEGESAIDFIVDMCNKYKEELTILCIGPLTNIAKAYLKNADALKKVKIVMMGGAFHKIEREWNIACDYGAAKIVFESGLNLTCIGVDVTKKVEISKELQEKILTSSGSDYFNYLIESANRWFNATNRRIVLHDPLALYYICDPEIFEMQEYHVVVEDEKCYCTALTIPLEELLWVQFEHINKDEYSKSLCARDVNFMKFIEIFNKELGF